MLPPGPALPPAVQLLAWLYQPVRFFDHCHARYGDLFTMRLPGQAPKVMLAGEDEIKAVFSGDPSSLHAGAANALVKPLTGSRSILILDGAAHQRQRRLLLSLFSSRKVVEHCQTMRELTDQAIDTWPVGKEFAIQPELQAITLRVIIATVFGVRDRATLQALYALLLELLAHGKSPLMLVPTLQRDLGGLTPWRRFVALNRQLDALLRPLYQQRRQQQQSGDASSSSDILSALVAARDEDGQLLSDQQLRDELVTLLVAGYETTANSLAWTLYHVLSHPAVYQRLSAELHDVVGPAPVGHPHLERLPYLDATIHEGLRITPVLGHVGRLLTQPMTLGGYALPAGCMVVPCIYLAHQNPRVFPEPQRFQPERFLNHRFSSNAYLPFGGGVRRCIGMSFAQHEMKIVLATILQRTRLTLRRGYQPTVTRRGVVWSPSGGVPVQQQTAPLPSL